MKDGASGDDEGGASIEESKLMQAGMMVKHN